MEIKIDKNQKIETIQEAFQNRFPYLKIEFYNQGHEKGKGSTNDHILSPDQTIGAVQTLDFTGTITIEGKMKVSDLEGAFAKNYGLPVQVFRKSDDLWLQTTVTDSWTLDMQNEKGREKHENPSTPIVDTGHRPQLG